MDLDLFCNFLLILPSPRPHSSIIYSHNSQLVLHIEPWSSHITSCKIHLIIRRNELHLVLLNFCICKFNSRLSLTSHFSNNVEWKKVVICELYTSNNTINIYIIIDKHKEASWVGYYTYILRLTEHKLKYNNATFTNDTSMPSVKNPVEVAKSTSKWQVIEKDTKVES